MTTAILILLAITLVGILGVLGAGVILMAKGGEKNKKFSNKIMQMRVYLQGFALLLFVCLILIKGAGS